MGVADRADEVATFAGTGAAERTITVVAGLGLGQQACTAVWKSLEGAADARAGLSPGPPQQFPYDLDWWSQFDGAPTRVEAWGKAIGEFFGTSGKSGRTLAQAELDGVLAAYALPENANGLGAIDLLVAYNQYDAKHRGAFALLRYWCENSWKQRSIERTPPVDLHLVPINVGVELSNGSISVLDEDAVVMRSEVLTAAEAVFIDAISNALKPRLLTGPVYYSPLSGASYLKHILPQVISIATTRARMALAGELPPPTMRREPPQTPTPPRALLHSQNVFSAPQAVDYSALQHRFHRAVTLVHSDREKLETRRLQVAEEGLSGLVLESSAGLRLSDTAWELIDDAEVMPGRPFSACAELLRQWDRADLASRLAQLIEHWTRQQLWRTNLANEMVLHNEVHSQAVDRHIASIAEAIGWRDEFTAEELYLLALTAWLHDWGHAAGGSAKPGPVQPQQVRKLHGLLTQRRLGSILHRDQHRLPPKERAWVGLLSAHHQSSTSCGHEIPAEHLVSTAERFGLEAKSFRAELAELDEEVRMRDAEPSVELSAELMLAVIRLADGADIGRHRAPHDFTKKAMLLDQWSMLFSTVHDALPDLETKERLRGLFPSRYVESVIGKNHSAEPAIVRVDGLRDDAAAALANAVSTCADYLEHLGKQQTFFDTHHRVLSVHLVPTKDPIDGTMVKLVPYVRVAPDMAEAALARVEHDTKKELGLFMQDPDDPTPETDTEKAARVVRDTVLRRALLGVGVRLAEPRILVRA